MLKQSQQLGEFEIIRLLGFEEKAKTLYTDALSKGLKLDDSTDGGKVLEKGIMTSLENLSTGIITPLLHEQLNADAVPIRRTAESLFAIDSVMLEPNEVKEFRRAKELKMELMCAYPGTRTVRNLNTLSGV